MRLTLPLFAFGEIITPPSTLAAKFGFSNLGGLSNYFSHKLSMVLSHTVLTRAKKVLQAAPSKSYTFSESWERVLSTSVAIEIVDTHPDFLSPKIDICGSLQN